METKNSIFDKLDHFISSYYKNQIIKGGILTLLFVLLLFLLVILGEYFFSFSSNVRTIIFYILMIFYVSLIFYFILWPSSKVFKLSKVISYKEAANIISGKFSGINDKLINLLELINLDNKNMYSKALTIASIEQKSTDLQYIKFTEAIDKIYNFKFLKYLTFVLIIFILLVILKPEILTTSTTHILQHDKEFVFTPQLNFEILNKNLNVEKGKDFVLNVRVGGDFLPSKLKVNFGSSTFFMEKTSKNEFTYTFKNLNNSLVIFFSTGNYSSDNYKLNVLPTPLINNMQIQIVPPSYTGEESKLYNNIGDLTILSGSIVKWSIETNNTNTLNFIFSDSVISNATLTDNLFNLSKRFVKSQDYSISIKNNFFEKSNYLTYSIKVIPDLFPTIDLLQVADSTNYSMIYFKGSIADDYGFSNLKFHYFINEQSKTIKSESITLDINKSQKTQEYFFSFDFSTLDLKPEQKIEYYFSVYDNDKPNGYKESKSNSQVFTVPSKQDIDDFENSKNDNIKSKADKSKELIKDLQKDIKKLKETLINEKTTDWEKTKMLNEINQKNNELKDLLQQLSEENKEKNEFMNSFSESQEDIIKKQEEIQQLLDELMTDELKELMEQIEQLEKEMNQDQMKDLNDKMDLTYKDIEEQLDRNLELLKRLEVEQKMEEAANDLKKLSDEQKELSEQLDNKNLNKENAKNEQENIEKELNRIEEEFKKADELNKDLKKSFQLENLQNDFNEISKEIDNSKQNLDDNKKSKSQKSMQNSSQKMKELSDKMQNMMQQNMMQQTGEDAESMRLMLKNLISFSKSQEDLMQKFTKVTNQDPKFVEYVNLQNKIKGDFNIIQDSLLALSNRVMQINKAVNTEIKSINYNLETTLSLLEDSRRGGFKVRQQNVMTSANNLALLLSEIIDNMEEQMSNSGQGQGKPGKKQKPSMGEMQQLQQGMKEMLEQYLKSLKDGKGGKGGKPQSEGLGKMLAKQEVMKKMLQDLKNGNSTGSKTQEFLKEIEKLMDETKNDLINRNVNSLTIERQKRIMDKLIEAENSETEKDKEEKRKSNEAKNHKISVPDYFQDKNIKKNSIKEDLDISNIKLKHYYNDLYNNYIDMLNK